MNLTRTIARLPDCDAHRGCKLHMSLRVFQNVCWTDASSFRGELTDYSDIQEVGFISGHPRASVMLFVWKKLRALHSPPEFKPAVNSTILVGRLDDGCSWSWQTTWDHLDDPDRSTSILHSTSLANTLLDLSRFWKRVRSTHISR